MANTKVSAMTALSELSSDDVFLVIDDPPGTPLNRTATAAVMKTFIQRQAETSTSIATLFSTTPTQLDIYPRSSLEIANSLTPITTTYTWGHVFRWMTAAQIIDVVTRAATLDVKTAVQNAILSGHAAYAPEGLYRIDDTVFIGTASLSTARTFITVASARFERFGTSTNPVFQVYGVGNTVLFNKATLAMKTQAHPLGILLLGQDPRGISGSTTDVKTTHNFLSAAKIIGAAKTLGADGSVGLYVQSSQRKLGDFTGINTYYNNIDKFQVIQSDLCVVASSDANANTLSDLTVLEYITAGVAQNATDRNQFPGFSSELPLPTNSTRRYLLQFGKHNSWVETDTNASYLIKGTYLSKFDGTSEIQADANRVVSVMDHDDPASGLFGDNEINLNGTFPGGIGRDGFSTELAIGPNRYQGPELVADYSRKQKFFDRVFTKPTAGGGSLDIQGPICLASGRKAELSESTSVDLFELDNIGATSGGVLFEFSFSAKADGVNFETIGKITWAAGLKGGSTFRSSKIVDFQTSFGDTTVVIPDITVAAGTLSDSMKVTVRIDTQAQAGDPSIFCGWGVKMTSTQLQGTGSTNLNWEADFTYL